MKPADDDNQALVFAKAILHTCDQGKLENDKGGDNFSENSWLSTGVGQCYKLFSLA